MCWRQRTRPIALGWAAMLLAALTACGGMWHHRSGSTPQERFEQFTLVTPDDRQPLAAVAEKHLGERSQAWLLAKVNPGDPVPGQPLIVPHTPLYRGGLYPQGYQVVPVLVYHNFSRRHHAKMKIMAQAFEFLLNPAKDLGCIAFFSGTALKYEYFH